MSEIEWVKVGGDFMDQALDALRALQIFCELVGDGRLDPNRLDFDRGDPLVAKVEQFVNAYRKQYAWPVEHGDRSKWFFEDDDEEPVK
jgi:hypothetical protein